MTPPTGDTTSDGLVNHIGRLVREERQKRYSIEQLARISGVSSGLISQMERGIGNPSIGNLWKLAEALDLPLGRFFVDSSRESALEGLVRVDERPTLHLSDHAVVYQILTPPDFPIQLICSTVPPGFDNSDSPFTHQGHEAIYMLSGCLSVRVGSRTYELGPGDTISLQASEPHSYCTIGTEPAMMLGAVTPPHVSVTEAHRLPAGRED